jgi:HAD superfamily phosphoserine phosphatase-like hydrolase
MKPESPVAARDFIVVDFDGTLACADVGNRLFRRFCRDHGRWERLIEDWKHGRITSRECLARECELTAGLDRAAAEAFAREFSLVPDAPAFVEAARAAGHEVTVASDGLSFYLEILLAKAGLALPFRANRLRFEAAGPVPEYGSRGPDVVLADGRVARASGDAGEGCGACGHCKGALVRAARAGGRYRRVLLVGDGFSDRCGAAAADVVYAKDDLLPWCGQSGIRARAFTTLADVARAEGWPGFLPSGYSPGVPDAPARGAREPS